MSNVRKVKKTDNVTVELGGRKRRLQFDMNAFGELEIKYGSIEAAMKAMESGSMKDLKVVLWAGLIHEEISAFDPDSGEPLGYNITPYQVGGMITSPTMLPEISKALAQAIGGSLPEAELEAAVKASEDVAKNFPEK